MKKAIQVGSDAIIYITNSIEIGLGIQKLTGAIHRLTKWISHKHTLGKHAYANIIRMMKSRNQHLTSMGIKGMHIGY
jgi:hypothetical protein